MSGSVEYVGHSTVLVDLDGVKLLTDPVLRPRVAHLRRAVPVDAAALRGVDAVLVSHGHFDHLDLPSLERLGRTLPLVVPKGLGPLLRRRRFEHVVELPLGEELRIGLLTVRPTFAAHDGARPPFVQRAEAVGYAILGSANVYFAGDTDLFEEMEGLVPDLDVALLPVWGWGANLGPGHLDPRRAGEAARRLRPRRAVPIHWGTYYPAHRGLRGAPTFTKDPAEAFAREAARTAPGVEVRVLAPGERLALSGR